MFQIGCSDRLKPLRFLLLKRKFSSKLQPTLTISNVNPQLKEMKYAVRGPIVIRANEIEYELSRGVKKPFTEVIRANIGDCHAMGQKPITFIRHVLALVAFPHLIEDSKLPSDVKKRATAMLGGCRGGSVGSYSDSPGTEFVRRHVADFITRRDGIECEWKNIYLGSGASTAIRSILKLLICQVDGKKPAVMVPIPQYPLYSATLTEYNLHQIGYQLDESKNWALNISELKKVVDEARNVSHPRAIVVINPGNPTGQVLTRQNIEDVIKFAHRERLFILTDEVYQDNIYAEGSKFFSFKKVMHDLGKPYSEVELASFHSCSKSFLGECGLRSGWAEVINLDPEVKKIHEKAITTILCPTVLGQTVAYAYTTPPTESEPSYSQYIKERKGVLGSFKMRADMVTETFNTFEGFTTNRVQGALYAFPRITLPKKAIEIAKKRNLQPDTFYAFELLEQTGICVISGSGFGQKPGTYHFRTTILPPPDKLKIMLDKFRDFHIAFMKKYR